MGDSADIDFVVLWVDGGDPKWLNEFNKYSSSTDGDKRICRFRDWDNLRYLFRSFEQFTPWVRRIYFVTWGHIPNWLNTKNEKLQVVRHDEFLKKENLPVFNANPIEINLHKLPGLCDKFVYFNDDMFLLNKLKKERFFKNNLPCDVFSFSLIAVSPIAHIKINNIQAINIKFNKKNVLKKNFSKIYSFKYRLVDIYRTLLLTPWPVITGFFDGHQPQSFLKSTFFEVWKEHKNILSKTSGSRFRNSMDLSQYLFRYWQLCSGNFYPINFRKTFSKTVKGRNDATLVAQKIISNKYEMCCINDHDLSESEFIESKNIIKEAFEKLLPNKSSFEI